MEDQVPFKVFAFWNEDSKPEVRRFGVEKSVVTSYHYLNAKLQDVYPGLKGKKYSVTWKDEDGDDITISSDEEMMTALTALHGNLIKLNVYIKSDTPKDDECDIIFTTIAENPPVFGPNNSSHYGVVCDACNSQVVGFRYKCTSCDDFDLCSKCEAAGLHPEHCMVRVPSPVMPRHLMKAAIKRSRHFLKTVANAAADGSNYHKRHRRDKNGDAHYHADRHCGDQNRGDHDHRRQRTSWLETFATYMNEFANLAGDVGVDCNQSNPTEPKPQEQQQAKTATGNTQAPTKQPEPSTSNVNVSPQCPFAPGMENIPKLIEAYFNGSLGSYLQQQAQPAQTAEPSQPTANTSAAAARNVNDTDVEMAQADQTNPKPQETDKSSIKSEDSTPGSPGSVRDVSPDKVDGWTMINKDKDLMDNFDKPSAPAEPAAPIGFNLPQEFQQRVTINEGQQLYPPLHAAAAVLNPKEPGSTPLPTPLKPQPAPAQRTPTPPKPQPPTRTQPQPQAQPQPQTPPHPKPHIEAAIKQMLAMGFTNEGGWLTQLLENVDGNIAAVMDLLTPVRSK